MFIVQHPENATRIKRYAVWHDDVQRWGWTSYNRADRFPVLDVAAMACMEIEEQTGLDLRGCIRGAGDVDPLTAMRRELAAACKKPLRPAKPAHEDFGPAGNRIIEREEAAFAERRRRAMAGGGR